MKSYIVSWLVFAAATLTCLSGLAQENENAVPLVLGLESSDMSLDNISVRLDGRAVTVSTKLSNGSMRERHVGWYASTPQFSILGIGEEHQDKSFGDVTSAINGKPSKRRVYQRGYFLGRDITAELSRAGLPALPDLDADPDKLKRLAPIYGIRPSQWKGYPSYAWTSTLPAMSAATIDIHYRALPAFLLVDVNSSQFGDMIRQHCGEPDAIRRRIHAEVGNATEVVAERYDVPIAYLHQQDVDVRIVQSQTNWLQARPFLTLVCGLPNENQGVSIAGRVHNANGGLSIMIVSAIEMPATAGVEHDGK